MYVPHVSLISLETREKGQEKGRARLTFLEVHIGTSVEKCREINEGLLRDKDHDAGYSSDIFDNLVYRYEEPNGMTRWDSPLFTVPFDDEAPPCDAIWDAMIGSEGKPKIVKPNTATMLVRPLLLCPLRP